MRVSQKEIFKKKLLGKASAKETFRESFIKAQSAMEYLMTYGWAILIVAVVLGALYSLGVFNGAAFLGTSCIAASGFYCTNPTLSTGGVLTVTIGQATGTTFNNAYLYFVPSGANFSTSGHGISIGTLNSGQQVTASILLPTGSPYPAAYTLGTPLSGYLYLQFTDIYGITEVNKIATVLTKVTASSSGATFSQPTSIPSGIVAYVPITLTNSQSSATPSPFQQMIQINEGNYANYIAYNGNIANFEFFTQSGQILPAWIESNNSGTLTVWVKLPNGISASASLTIYLGFASKTTNLLSSSGTSGIGEAPQLSSTYAQYDDGASVFNFYDNFAGTSLNTNKWLSYSDGFSATINNGFTISLSAGQIGSGGNADYVITSQTAFSPNIIAEVYAQGSSAVTNTRSYMPGLTTTTSTTEGVYILDQTSYLNMAFSNGRNNVVTYADFQGSSSAQYYNNVASPSGYNIIGLAYTGSTNTWYMNYMTVISSSTDSPSGNVYFALGMGVYNGNPYAVSMSVYWVRVRAYPPNGVMPSVSFGGLSTA